MKLLSWLVLLIAVVGCGAAKSGDAASSGGAAYPGAPMADSVQTVSEGEMMMEADEAPPAPPEPAPVARHVTAGTSGGAPPPAQAPMPAAKAAPARERPEEAARDTRDKAQSPSGAPVASGAQKAAVASQMLVYTADIRLRVQEVPKAIDAVEKLAKEMGGYLVVRQDNRITVRVPSAKFDASLDELVKLGELTHRNVSIEDVTDLYFDMQTRMKNLEVVKKRLEELLEKAKTVEESLAVQRQLERVTIELERLRGKLKLLAELVMFSTITVMLEPKSTEHIDSKVRLPFPWMDRLGLGELLRL
ncbi:MAG: DUF4349 domain-containing protein [Myxococcales bacterium]|nr:DUF4349 domain-containing protein [Myxococcales bacterium]